MIGIIDYGMGNLTSVKNALDFLNLKNTRVANSAEALACDKLILPGVGAFALAMENLTKSNLVSTILEFTSVQKKPFLGLCLGMQLLFENSTEHGFHNGLSLIKGQVKDLNDKVHDFPVPHMGWNSLKVYPNSVLLKNIPEEEQVYYFVHSYYCDAADKSNVKAVVNYSFDFDVVLEKENIFGCQFHPEKSQKSGLKILQNFGDL
jgi:glutamine amidotransferase